MVAKQCQANLLHDVKHQHQASNCKMSRTLLTNSHTNRSNRIGNQAVVSKDNLPSCNQQHGTLIATYCCKVVSHLLPYHQLYTQKKKKKKIAQPVNDLYNKQTFPIQSTGLRFLVSAPIANARWYKNRFKLLKGSLIP